MVCYPVEQIKLPLTHTQPLQMHFQCIMDRNMCSIGSCAQNQLMVHNDFVVRVHPCISKIPLKTHKIGTNMKNLVILFRFIIDGIVHFMDVREKIGFPVQSQHMDNENVSCSIKTHG